MGDSMGIRYLEPAWIGPWPYSYLPDEVCMYERRWLKAPPGTQLVDHLGVDVVGGYREDTDEPGGSLHMYVLREPSGELSYCIDHTESHPARRPLEHAVEVTVDLAKKHPIAALFVAGLAIWALTKK